MKAYIAGIGSVFGLPSQQLTWTRSKSLLKSMVNKLMPCGRVLWGADIGESAPAVQYAEIMESDSGVQKWTDMIVFTPHVVHHYCFLHGL